MHRAVKYLELTGAHQHRIAFTQNYVAASGLRDDRARLIDDEGKIAIAVGEEFAGSGDAGRRHRRRHYLDTGQHPDQYGALQRSGVDGLDIELH